MAVPQNFMSVGMDTVPTYFIYRDVVLDPLSPPIFYPAKDSDELFDALRIKYPHVPNHADRMRDAIIDYLLEERAAESFQTSPALTVDPSTVSWTSASSGTMSSFFNSPDNLAMPTPASLNHSPLPEAPIGDHSVFASGAVDRSPQSLDAMTGVFSVSTGAQPKQRTRRKMTEAEKVDYRNRRIAKACEKCAKRKRKCQHGENATAPIAAPKIVKSARAAEKQARLIASIQDVQAALPDQTSLFRLEDIGTADLFDISMLGDLDMKPEDFMFDAFVYESHFANFGDQNFQAVTNSANSTLQDSAPRRPRAPSIMAEDFELYSPPRDSEDGWATSTNPTTLNFASLTGGQQSATHSSLSRISQQNLQQAAQSSLSPQSTNAPTSADTTALFATHQSQTAPAQLTRARGCPRLGNSLLQSATTIDSPVLAMRNIHHQIIAPDIPHDAEGHGSFATDRNANRMSIFATCDAHGMHMPPDISTIRTDCTIGGNRTIHQTATQASNAMLASAMFADDGQMSSDFLNAARRPLSLMTGRPTYADLQQRVVQDLSSQTSAGQNIAASMLVNSQSRRSHAATAGTLAGRDDAAAPMLAASYGYASQPSYLQLGGREVSHAGLSSRAVGIPVTLNLAIQAPSSSGTQNQQDDGRRPATDLGISRYDYTDQFAPADVHGKSLSNNVADTQLPARSQQTKNETSFSALLLPQGVSLACCLLVAIALFLVPLGVDKFTMSFLMLMSLASHGYGWDAAHTRDDRVRLDDDKLSTRKLSSHSPLWSAPSILRRMNKVTSAQTPLLACTTAKLRIGIMT
jgi:hypothetical protein